MKRLIPLLLALTLLCACTGKTPENTDPPATTLRPTDAPQPSTQSTDAPETQPPATEEPMLYQNPLNGQPMAAPYTGRPVAVMLNNIRAAMPQHGVSQADILYEVLAEGGITRCMGIYSDITQVAQVGSIRSARKYYVDIARGYHALYVHFGGSTEATNYLKNIGWNELDGMVGGTKYFFQDQKRIAAGYASEHTWFADGEKLLAYALDKGYSTQESPEKTYGMQFDDSAVIVGTPAENAVVYFNMGGKPGSGTKSTGFTYDADAGVYFASQYGGDYIDGNTNEAISFRNVLVLRTANSLQSDGYHMTVITVGSGKGTFLCNGQAIPILWNRAGEDAPFTYTLENGTPLTFGVGATYVAIVPTNATLEIS